MQTGLTEGDRGIHKNFEEMFDIIYEGGYKRDPLTAFDKLLEFLVVDMSDGRMIPYIPNVEWWFSADGVDLIDRLTKKNYSREFISEIKGERHDHLGEIYTDVQSTSSKRGKGQFFTPTDVTQLIATMSMDASKGPVKILDPCIGSGRFMIAAANINPEARIYGVDIDLRATQISMVNAWMFNIHAFLLHANALLHEIDIKYLEGQENWR